MTSTAPSIAYLGPEGTYSHEAARLFADKLAQANEGFTFTDESLVPCASFDEVFDTVERNRCPLGVVATENVLEGPVTATLDNFALNSSASILAVHTIDIHHCLITHPAADRAQITTIASHPQGLGQCWRYLAAHFPTTKLLTCASTAESVQVAMDDPHVAAIANEYAAKLYGAHVAERDIEDRFGNQTSFALIGRPGNVQVPGERVRTSVALFLKEDRAGSLHMILSELAFANINITMIQSRPTRRALGDYMFYLDLDSSLDNPALLTALNCLRLKLREVKVLGCYPVD